MLVEGSVAVRPQQLVLALVAVAAVAARAECHLHAQHNSADEADATDSSGDITCDEECLGFAGVTRGRDGLVSGRAWALRRRRGLRGRDVF